MLGMFKFADVITIDIVWTISLLYQSVKENILMMQIKMVMKVRLQNLILKIKMEIYRM